MFLYLVRHGEAKSKDEDSERSLSGAGVEDVKNVALAISKKEVVVKNIFHSGKARAEQTAQIIADAISPSKGVLEKEGLKPNDDPAVWASRIEDMDDSIMLVGHLPNLEVLASLLLGRGSVWFSVGQTVCLERDTQGSWSLKWTIAPADIS
jgi:phosphohistidine phosphatase